MTPSSRLPSVIELRQYTLHPGQREVLIELFEREFMASQQACGIELLGQFRDLDRPDHFVWLRGFADMPARAQVLAAFYGGPVWQAHRDAANATMMDSDDVLLLRPVRVGRGLGPQAGTGSGAGVVLATVCPLRAPADDALVDCFDRTIAPGLAGAGAELLACCATESAPNNFPRLPVREGEPVLVWFTRLSDPALHAAPTLPDEFLARLSAAPQVLRLSPTERSPLSA
ncbi:NIPSNAP family protein [Ideonella sp. BN130291]|uniref:NIPSNAP family protein n=1 Tax=Ideonella sp. BN130291 TaxID=3112940 RepID=UPI002E265196|nr:NIPSNAP family protein [Ideonella sp. BN130291]